jgi:hypothetical protein
MGKISKTIFSSTHFLFFKVITPAFEVDTFKPLMDRLYIYFEVIASHFPFVNQYYLQFYSKITDHEIQLASINEHDHVLVIGSGSLPITPLLIAEKTNARVHTVDIDEKAVRNASAYIDRFQMSQKITVSLGDACFLDMAKYDVIFILYGICGLEQVFSALDRSASSDARIIYRVPPDCDLLKNDSSTMFETFVIKDQVATLSLGGVVSLLLIKKH